MFQINATAGEQPPALLVRETEADLPLFTISEAARILPGDPMVSYNRLKGLASRRLVHQRFHRNNQPRQRKGRGATSAVLWGIDDLAAARLLTVLLDLGVSDAEIMQAASLACYAWHQELNPRPATAKAASPIFDALAGAAIGDFWFFTLKTYHHDQTDQRALLAIVAPEGVNLDGGLVLPPEYLSRASVSIILPPLLLPLVSRAFGKK